MSFGIHLGFIIGINVLMFFNVFYGFVLEAGRIWIPTLLTATTHVRPLFQTCFFPLKFDGVLVTLWLRFGSQLVPLCMKLSSEL